MTNKDAVMVLKLFCELDPESKTSVSQAFKMAIKALEQPEIIRCKDCEFNQNKDGTTGCDFHNFWYASNDGYCNFGRRKEEK